MSRSISSPADLSIALSTGETQEVEFKSRVPHPHELAKHISAFTNSTGGTLLIGVGDHGNVLGADVDEVKSKLDVAYELVAPSARPPVRVIPYEGKSVVAIDIQQGDVTAAEGQPFVRSGTDVRPLKGIELRERVLASTPDRSSAALIRIADILAAQTDKIDKLQHALDEAQSWKSKMPELLVGAALGAVFGFLLSMLVT